MNRGRTAGPDVPQAMCRAVPRKRLKPGRGCATCVLTSSDSIPPSRP
jgi:hypothetical protein